MQEEKVTAISNEQTRVSVLLENEATEPRVIDFTKETRGWGHNITSWNIAEDKKTVDVVGLGTLGGKIFGSFYRVGDIFMIDYPDESLWKFEIQKIKYESDPRDMFYATLKPVGVDEKTSVSTEAH